jgi:RHO1 GDP-GTP exchange protein 1/2
VKKVGWSTLLIRPITRLPRYDLLLAELVKTASAGHEDQDTLAQTRELITSLAKETQPGVASAQQKVKLWQYNSDLVFKPGETIVRATMGSSF